MTPSTHPTSAALALALVVHAATPASGQVSITVRRTAPPAPIAAPDAAAWAGAPVTAVPLLPQAVALPSELDPATKELKVRAVHDGAWLALLVEWADATQSDVIYPDTFGDQVAVELPVDAAGPPPSPMMGNAGGRVNIMQWRAALQRDLDVGPPEVRGLYPNAWIDVYPDQLLGASDARPYAGALGLENPVSRAVATPVLDQMAEGWGTMTAKPDQRATGKGTWKDGTWRVVIARPLASDDPNAPLLRPGVTTVVAFAAWDGGSAEVGARKAWSAWTPLVLEP
jgi:hypothetical protein